MENRRNARVPSRMRCWCEGGNVTLYSRVGNLSEGGMFLRTSTPLQEGTRATVRLGVGEENGPELHTAVKVVWSRKNGHTWPPGMGLAFEELDAANLERLRQIISHEQTRWPGA
ncbi:TIGR02266 family protein [Hyalangium rubrum]|uniref:TIGR02266 family protein n=1 Tax=Hyalangium rubrum TaxID=3103134 RepID=A0ABU5HI06_9BACT|nr:TIGR02266 family protein [Hyalangium sp. s54d21]MDY7232876.1 TIGR02266 family protein [Hyalangium sp. s54d21]